VLRYHVLLEHKSNGDWVCLREINGEDEDLVEGTSTAVAIQLLDRLLTAEAGAALGPGDAVKLTAPDRDRLLAFVYARTYGSRIDSTANCKHCGKPFDLDFSLDTLQANLAQNRRDAAIELEDNEVFRLPDDRCFRLPTGEDELAVFGLSSEEAQSELLARCLVNGDPNDNPETIQDAMQKMAPILDLELDAICPECDHKQSVHFDIQSYLLTAIKQERNRLMHEVHRLASAYGWSLDEIMSLARNRRRALASLVEAELRGGD
jgi:hypothetical protein